MRRGQDHVERRRLLGGEVELPGGINVRFNTLKQPELRTALGIHGVDGFPLFGRFGHRHAAGDLQSVRVIGDSRVLIAALETGIGNLLHGRVAVAPFGVHLQITAVLRKRRAPESRIRQHSPDFSPAEKVPPKLASALDILAIVAFLDGAFDRGGFAGRQNFADDPRGAWPDA
jgi:hypothetical protein